MTSSLTSGVDDYCSDPESLVLLVDASGIVTWVGPKTADVLGADVSLLVGDMALSHIHPSDFNSSAILVGSVVAVPGARCRLRIRIRSGATSFVLLACEVVNELDNPDIGSVVLILRRSRLAVLDESGSAHLIDDPRVDVIPNPLEPVVHSLTDGVVISTSSGVEHISPNCARMLGRDLDELMVQFADLCHPDDQAAFMRYVATFNNSPGVPVETKLRIARGDGEWGVFALVTINLMDDPDIASFVSVLRAIPGEPGSSTDIAHEADSDEFVLRRALNRAADPVMTVGSEGKIRFASSSTSVLLHTSVSAMMARLFVDYVTAECKRAFLDWFDGTTKTSSVRIELERPDGSTNWVDVAELLDDERPVLADRVLVLRDIHPQVLAEIALREREAWFEALVRNAPGCVFVLGPDDTVTYASESVEQMLGFQAELVVGMRIEDGIHPDDRGEVLAALGQARATGSPVVVTSRVRVADASLRWFTATVQDYGPDAVVQGVVVNLLDRTDEIVAGDALNESERRFRALVQHSFEVTVVLDEQFRVLWISPSVEDLLGWEPEHYDGANATDFVHPDDLSIVMENLESVLQGVNPRPLTILRARDRVGEWRSVVTSISDRRADPDIGGYIINLRDATDQVASKAALEASESRYRTLVQNSTDVVQIMSASARVIWVSPAVENVLGWTPDELVNEPTGALDGLSGREPMVKAFLSVLASPGEMARCVSRVQHRDGSWRWIDVVLVNRLDRPEIEGIVATYRDVTERVETEQARRTSEERFRSLAESSPLGIFQLDLSQRCTYVNDRWCEITGEAVDDSLGDGWRKSIRRGGHPLGVAGTDIDLFADDSGVQIVRSDGDPRWCDIHFAPLTDDRGDRIGWVGTIDDITRIVRARHEARRLSTILEATTDLVLLFDPGGTLVYLNKAASAFMELEDDVAIRQMPVADILPPENIALWHSEILPSLESGRPWQGETTVENHSGDIIPISAVAIGHLDDTGKIELVSITARDMSDRKALEARLQHQATHDPLTGLPNRTLLLDRLGVAMRRNHRLEGRLAVIFMDLDHFKVVNDSLGHGTGDQLLNILAERLGDQVRPGDTVARFGGDEFVLVCEDLEDAVAAEEIAARIATAVAQPAWIEGAEVVVTASLGIALVDHLHQDPDQVLRDADAAMYQAKARGRARYELFDPRFRTKALARLEVETALRRAMARDELVVHYQPVFDLTTMDVVGVEALLRWAHPDRALLLPGEFLGVAEESGLIEPIGEWVLREACTRACEVAAAFPDIGPLTVAVNLSGRQIANPKLVELVTRTLDETGMDAANLTLEITESILMEDVVQSNETLGQLKSLGIKLAIDDFGTGYSSFAYLQKFPVDVLKVDQSFVARLGDEPGAVAITDAIVSLGHTLGLVAVAEGVESEYQRDALAKLGCDQAQGFLLSRPLDLPHLKEFLADQQRVQSAGLVRGQRPMA